MLVTIASNSDNDASQFVNYFPEGLIIPKNAKIGVVNCSYVLHEGYIVDATNNTFQLRLANMANYATITVAQGIYQTGDDLAEAIQTALQTWIGTQSSVVQNAFPAAQQTVSANQQGNEITIHLTFASEGTDQELLNSTGDINAFIKDITRCQGDAGQYVNISDLPSNNDNYVATGDGGANHYWLASLSKIGQNFFARASATPQRNDCRTDLLLVPREDMDKSNAPINVAFKVAGTVVIYEMVAGVQTQINTGSPPSFNGGDTVEIRIPAIPSDGSSNVVNAEYFLTSGGNTTEIAIDQGVGRYNIQSSDEFLVKYEFDHASKFGQIASKDDAVALNDAVLATSIDTSGANYLVGDILTQSTSTGSGTGVELQITKVGEVTGDVLTGQLISTGEGHAPNDILEFSGGNGVDFRLQVDSVQVNYAVTALGATYTAATGVALTGGSGSGATCAITTTDVSGGITGLTITDPGDGYTATDVLTVSGGDGNAQVTIGQVVDTLNWVSDLKANLVENPPNQRPLVIYDSILARMQTLASLINCKDRYHTAATLDISSESAMQTNNRTASNLHIQLDSVGGGIESREFGVNGKTVAVVPLGDNSNAHAGLFNNELFNIIYHNLKNPEPLQNNELAVRLTDYKNNIIKSVFHPVTITFDVRPELE